MLLADRLKALSFTHRHAHSETLMLLDKVISLNLFKGNIMFNIYSTNYASMSTENQQNFMFKEKCL